MDTTYNLSDFSREELEDFIIGLAKSDEHIAAMVTARFAKTGAESELGRIKSELNQIVRGSGDRYGFIGYHDSYRFEKEMSRYIWTIIPQLLDAQKTWLSFEVLCAVVYLLSSLDIDDSNGTISTLLNVTIDLMDETISKMKTEEKRRAREWFENHMYDENIIDFIQDELFEAYTDLFDDEESLKAQIAFVDSYLNGDIDSSEDDDFSVRLKVEKYAETRIRCMEKLNYPEKDIFSFLEKYLSLENICMFAAEKYIAHGDYDSAEKLLLNLIEASKNHRGVVRSAKEKLLALYKKTENERKIAETERYLFLNECQFNQELYREYKSHFSDEEWKNELKNLLSEKDAEKFKDEIFVEEKMYRNLFESVKKRHARWKSFYPLEKYAKYLKADYAEELLEMFAEVFDEEAKRASYRGQYYELAQHLAFMAKLPSGKAAAFRLREKWFEIYQKRPAFKDELVKVKL